MARTFGLGVIVLVVVWAAMAGLKVYAQPRVSAEIPLMLTITSLSAASTDETLGTAATGVQMGKLRETAVYISWGTGVVSGAVQVETAHDSSYSGEWAPMGSAVSFSGTAPRQDVVQITGVHGALRTRVSTAITGGTVTTYIVGN